MAGPEVVVGGVVVHDGKLLMIRRRNEPSRGLWSVPGGRVEKGEYLTDAVAREVEEETGVAVEVRDLLGILEVVGDPHYVILDYLAAPTGDATPVAASDADEVRWVPLAEVSTLECTPRFCETLRGWGVEI
jgi:8-oxo-dGTP diphosphatase